MRQAQAARGLQYGSSSYQSSLTATIALSLLANAHIQQTLVPTAHNHQLMLKQDPRIPRDRETNPLMTIPPPRLKLKGVPRS